MLKKSFKNEELGIEMNSFIDNKQNIWFRGKDVAEILGYSKPRNAIERHVSNNHKILQLYRGPETGRQQNDTRVELVDIDTEIYEDLYFDVKYFFKKYHMYQEFKQVSRLE